MKNVILFFIALAIMIALKMFIIVDFVKMLNRKKTFSQWCWEVRAEYADHPLLWVGIGATVGFAVALVLGFILGHLFWGEQQVI